jgi:hypothetical protein
MSKDPWTDPNPQPGDFDRALQSLDSRDIQIVEAGSGATIAIVVNVKGEDAERLTRIAARRGLRAEEVVADLLRQAEPHTA